MSRKNKKVPDYGFRYGLDYAVHSYGSEPSLAEHHMTRDELQQLPNVGDDPERDAKVAEQMKRTLISRGIGGRAVSYHLVGPEDAESVIFQGFGWGGDAAHPVAIGEMQALAASAPDSQWLVINTPGSGQTEALPPSIARDLRRTGNHQGLGEHYATAVADVIDDREVHLRGHSLGGRTALAMAPHIEGGVESLIINDPTGSKRKSLGSIAHSFAIKEGRHLGNYIKAGFDPLAAERQGAAAPDAKMTLDKFRQMFTIDPLALTRGTLETDLSLALPFIKKELRILSPELSELNDPEHIGGILERLSPSYSNTMIEQWVLRRHSHSFMAVSPAVEARLYQSRNQN